KSMQPRCIGLAVTLHHKPARRLDQRPGGENEIAGRTKISQFPSGEIEGPRRRAMPFDPVRGWTGSPPCVNDDGPRWPPEIWLAGRALEHSAAPPIGGIIGIAQRIDNFEGIPVAIRFFGPSIGIRVIHRDDRLSFAGDEGDAFPAIDELTIESAEDSDTG